MEQVFIFFETSSSLPIRNSAAYDHIDLVVDLLQRIGCIESENILPVSGYDSFSEDSKMSYLCMPVEGTNCNLSFFTSNNFTNFYANDRIFFY